MTGRGIWQLAVVEAKLFARDPVSAFFTVVFPALLLLLFGGIYGNHPAREFGGSFGNVDVMVPGYMAMVSATTGLLALGIGMAGYREKGILRRFQVAPINPLAVFVSQFAVAFVAASIGVALMIVTGKLAFGLRFSGNPLWVATTFTLSCASMFSIGFALAGLVPTARTALVTGAALLFPMLFLSGALIPKEILPAAIRPYLSVVPLTHSVDLIRAAWAGRALGDQLLDVGVLVVLMLAGVAFAVRTFRWE